MQMTLVAELVSYDVGILEPGSMAVERAVSGLLGKTASPPPISQMNEMGFQLRRAAPVPPPPLASWRAKGEHRVEGKWTNGQREMDWVRGTNAQREMDWMRGKCTKGDELVERKNRYAEGCPAGSHSRKRIKRGSRPSAKELLLEEQLQAGETEAGLQRHCSPGLQPMPVRFWKGRREGEVHPGKTRPPAHILSLPPTPITHPEEVDASSWLQPGL